MQIEKSFYPITSLGPNNRLGIWTKGCVRKCKGCSNPETQAPSEAFEISIEDLLKSYDFSVIDGVTISGGEPFMQLNELLRLLTILREKSVNDILVYTGYTYEELKNMNNPIIDEIFSKISVLIDGPYIDELNDEHILKGSSNQRILYFDESLKNQYEEYIQKEKQINIIKLSNGETHFIGIPPKDFRELYPEYLKAKYITERKNDE